MADTSAKKLKLKEIQRRYRDKKKEKEAAQTQQIKELMEQVAALQRERDRLQESNSQLDRFARLSLSQSVAAPAAPQDETALAYTLLAEFANCVNSVSRVFVTAEDIRAMSMRAYDQLIDRAYVRNLAELLLGLSAAGGMQRLEDYVISCRAAGLRALKYLPLTIYSQLNCLSDTFAQSDEQVAKILADMALEPGQEQALVRACHAFHAERQRIWDRRRSVTARLQAPELAREEPFAGPELRSANSAATGAVLEAAEALRASIREEQEAVFSWYHAALQVLTPLQEARAIMAAAPLSFSPWYIARYLDRQRAGWDGLALLEEWGREPRALDDLDAMLLGEMAELGADPLAGEGLPLEA